MDTDAIFARAQIIFEWELSATEGNVHAAIVRLTGSEAVAELLEAKFGSAILALRQAAYQKAKKE